MDPILNFRVPVGGQSSKIGGNLGVTLTYGFEHGGLTGGYFHGLSGGSGVLTGSTVDQVNLSATRVLSRVWTGYLNFGYAHNTAVVSSTESTFPNYNSWFFGGGASRPFGRNTTLTLAYNANIAKYNIPDCTVGACNSNQTFNSIIINFQWHTRPFVLP